MQIKDVMTTKVCFVGPDTPLAEVARLMRDEDIGSVPVVEDDGLIGIVTDRDIVVRTIADQIDPRHTTARTAMSPQILYCYDDQTIEETLANMGDIQVRRLPVVNREKRLVGVVSLGDLSKADQQHAGDALKEISERAHS